MSLAATIARSLKQIESKVGSKVFTWEGKDYPCTPSGRGEGGTQGDGGLLTNISLVLVVRQAVFPNGTLPREKRDKITYNGMRYLVDSIRIDPTGTFVRLLCESPNKVRGG